MNTLFIVLSNEAERAACIIRSCQLDRANVASALDIGTTIGAMTEDRPSHFIVDCAQDVPPFHMAETFRHLRDMNHPGWVIVIGDRQHAAAQEALRVASAYAQPVIGPVSPVALGQSLAGIRGLLRTSSADESAVADTEHQAVALSATALEQLIKADGVVPVLQPKVGILSGDLVGFEALARCRNADGTTLMPDQFIPVAERSGLINEITEQMLMQSIGFIQRSPELGTQTIAVNVSAVSFEDDAILRIVDRVLRTTQFDPRRLTLEVTESNAVANSATHALFELRAREIGLSIDDFGVGYSSLVQLVNLPFTELKIDKQFIKDLASSPESRSIVSALVGMCRELGLKTLAEGVEDLETFEILRQLGCESAQGYFIGRPMSLASTLQWVA